MDKKYHIDDRKKKISELLQNIEEKYKLSQEEKDFIRSFSKKIMFLKELYYLKFFFNNENKKYYVEQMISDCFYIINTFLEVDSRYFYLNYRSIIEQFCGLFNNILLSNERILMHYELSTINNFININNLKNEKKQKLDYSLLKSCYSKACMYVHGNPNADYLNISFFQEIEAFKTPNADKQIKTRKEMKNDIENLFNILLILLSYKYSEIISNLFFRKKEILKFYIGEFCYEIIKNYKTVEIIHKKSNNKILGTSYVVKNKKDDNFSHKEIEIIIPNYILKSKNDFEEKLYSEFNESIDWIWENFE